MGRFPIALLLKQVDIIQQITNNFVQTYSETNLSVHRFT